jgi:hypothetical protein
MSVCIRTEEYKLIYYQKLAMGELYDLAKDPDETNNLWDASSAKSTRAMMTDLALSRMIDTVDPRPERKCMW